MRRVREDDKKRLNELLGIAATKVDTETATDKHGKVVLARFAGRVRRLRANYKGTTLKARVLANGLVSFKGKRYKSPSMAGQAVLHRACNGWQFWTYERTPREWVKLDTLRR